MLKFFMGMAAFVVTTAAAGAPIQVRAEAEVFPGGTVVADIAASGGAAVTRTTDGIYAWWVSDTSSLNVGTYSLYARVALAANITGSKNFGPQIFYGATMIASPSIAVTSNSYKWVKLGTFDLTQIGGQLRISDWSQAGITLDELAIVQDVGTEAELISGGTIVLDSAASGGKAVTRSSTGGYIGWAPSQSNLAPGDYDVYVKLRSADGNGHNYGSYVTLDGATVGPVSAVVSSTIYQWIKFNSFTNAGGSQSIVIADYSEAGLDVDAVKITRQTPYDQRSAAQVLFAAGAAALGPVETLVFNGTAAGLPAESGGRLSVVQASASTVYAYFRQLQATGGENYDIYMATSTDGGLTFTVNPTPVIPQGSVPGIGLLNDAYDPQVTKRPDGYYMVFEGTFASGCGFSAITAYSPDGVNNWAVKNVTICGNAGGDGFAGISTPSFYSDADSGAQYLQWVTINTQANIANNYQYNLSTGGLLGTNLTFSSMSSIASYAFPMAAASSWEGENFGAGNFFYENGSYYHVYEGATSRFCAGVWGIGIARNSAPATASGTIRSLKNPILSENPSNNSCWIEYPQLVALPQGTYIYYWDGLINQSPTAMKEYRRKIITD